MVTVCVWQIVCVCEHFSVCFATATVFLSIVLIVIHTRHTIDFQGAFTVQITGINSVQNIGPCGTLAVHQYHDQHCSHQL